MSTFDIQQFPPSLKRDYIEQERNTVEDEEYCRHGIKWTEDCPECNEETER